jgi:co-chaperonin GroES (HSP10)
MKIKPIGDIIQLEIKQANAGVLNTSSRESAVEFATVIAVPKDYKGEINQGDSVFVKSWAVDIITHEDTKYHFVNINTGGILAVVTK